MVKVVCYLGALKKIWVNSRERVARRTPEESLTLGDLRDMWQKLLHNITNLKSAIL